MTDLQRAIFLALHFEDVSYSELAERHGISPEQVQADFAEALGLLFRELHQPEGRWRRLWPF